MSSRGSDPSHSLSKTKGSIGHGINAFTGKRTRNSTTYVVVAPKAAEGETVLGIILRASYSSHLVGKTER